MVFQHSAHARVLSYVPDLSLETQDLGQGEGSEFPQGGEKVQTPPCKTALHPEGGLEMTPLWI